MLSEQSCSYKAGSAKPARKSHDTAQQHPSHTPASSRWKPRIRTATAVLTGAAAPDPARKRRRSAPAYRAAARTCLATGDGLRRAVLGCRPDLPANRADFRRAHWGCRPRPRLKIPRRCAALTPGSSEQPASMDSRHHTGARSRRAPRTRGSSRLLQSPTPGARSRRAPRTRGSSRLERGLRSGQATRGRLKNASCAAFASPLAPAPFRAGHIRSGALRRLGKPAARRRAGRQALVDAPPPHGSLIALTFARGGVALRLAAFGRSLAGLPPGPASKARGQSPRLPGLPPRTLLGRRSHRSRCGSTLRKLFARPPQDARAEARANSG